MSRVVTVTRTARLVASTYGRSNNSYVTVTDPENMYENTDDSSNVCSIRGRNNANNTYYCYIRGFNIGDIPSDATVKSFKVKIKCYRNSYLRQDGSTYYLHLCNNTSAISNTYMSEAVTTSSSGAVYEIPTGSLTWANIKQYGTNFGIRVPLRSTSSSQRPYLYVYGAEIEVTYDIQVTQYEVTITNNAGSVVTVDPTGQQWVDAGETQKISFSTNQGFNVTDNNGEVTLTVEDGRYWYVISNISADHTIVVTPNSSGTGVWIKVNGQWVQGADIKVKYGDRWRSISEVYVFKEGSWIQAENGVKDIFNTQAIFLKG